MSEKIDSFLKNNKGIVLIIILFSFQLLPIISLIFPDIPTLAKVLENIFQIVVLILTGIQMAL